MPPLSFDSKGTFVVNSQPLKNATKSPFHPPFSKGEKLSFLWKRNTERFSKESKEGNSSILSREERRDLVGKPALSAYALAIIQDGTTEESFICLAFPAFIRYSG
jgi:hypothetical protein